MEPAFKDLTELAESELYKRMEERSAVVSDWKCLGAIRTAAHNVKGEMAVYRKTVGVLSKLIEDETRAGLGEEIKEKEKSKASEQQQQPGYKENIFCQEDFVLYRGVVQFYSKNYKQAIADFEESARIKAEQKATEEKEEIAEEEKSSAGSGETDLSDVGLCAVNVNEHTFNLVLCFILVRKTQQLIVHPLARRHEIGAGKVRGHARESPAKIPYRRLAAAGPAERVRRKRTRG